MTLTLIIYLFSFSFCLFFYLLFLHSIFLCFVRISFTHFSFIFFGLWKGLLSFFFLLKNVSRSVSPLGRRILLQYFEVLNEKLQCGENLKGLWAIDKLDGYLKFKEQQNFFILLFSIFHFFYHLNYSTSFYYTRNKKNYFRIHGVWIIIYSLIVFMEINMWNVFWNIFILFYSIKRLKPLCVSLGS